MSFRTSDSPEAIRVAAAWAMARPEPPVVLSGAALLEPMTLARMLAAASGNQVIVTGTLDRRLLLLEDPEGRWVVADLSGLPHASRHWPSWAVGHLCLEHPDSWLTSAELDEEAAHRLTRPAVLVAALYHREQFPLPRFPLGISALARAARTTLMGRIELADMQLGLNIEDLVRRVIENTPDILGVSATFGQHDLMTELLDAAHSLDVPPLVIAGGSLTARNERLLLDRYPGLLVARGAGEPTVQDILAHWHGDITREQIHGIGYNAAARNTGSPRLARRHTARPVNRAAADILPELDLLAATFRHHGVAQLETSRGCTNYCSFCPRGHKGQWAGSEPRALPWLLAQMGKVFDLFPEVSRTLYLVDEEFIGRGDNAVPRALHLANTLRDAGFRWETSCRVDQVVRPDQGMDWHVERAEMWRSLVAHGLRRCLFGVESGVDSILERFNKETTGEQNALAIRTLSALGVPTRFTYISFDHLMTMEELEATYAFQGRTDLLLQPLPHLEPADIVAGVRDPAFVAEHAAGRPLHTAISYMLVSMECLTGAAYTKMAEQAGLTSAARASMGRIDARFADWRIGVCSQWAQLWVDRSFSLDYTFKSLEKILDGRPRRVVREARVVLKEAAYTVFGHLLAAAKDTDASKVRPDLLSDRLVRLLDAELDRLRDHLRSVVAHVARQLTTDQATLLRTEHERWAGRKEWSLLNAAGTNGTQNRTTGVRGGTR